MKKNRLKKLVVKDGSNQIESILTKDKMKLIVGGDSGYCARPGLACYNFSTGCTNIA